MHDALPALESRLRELSAQMADRDDLSAFRGGDSLEHMEAIQRRELRREVLGIADREAAEVQAAIQRVKDGTYGICVECDKPISAGRLKYRQCATRCLSCQEVREALGRVEDGVELAV